MLLLGCLYVLHIHILSMIVLYASPLWLLTTVYWISASTIIFMNLVILFELFTAYCIARKLDKRKISYDIEKLNKSDIKLGILIPAYMPNEKSIIYDTLTHYSSNVGKVVVLLVYNGDCPDDIMSKLKNVDFPSKVTFRHINNHNSKSKAENVNFGIKMLENDFSCNYIAIYDADHKPDKECFVRALSILEFKEGKVVPEIPADQSYDVVQGRCRVRNNFLNDMEFSEMYLVYHVAGSFLRQFSLFGGSNAVWRTKALFNTEMDMRMLTEDIDSGLRAHMGSYNLGYCYDMVSSELAPTSILSLYKQRLRWAQGWLQVTLRHYINFILKSGSLWEKIVVTFLLPFREFFHYGAIHVGTSCVIYLIKYGFNIENLYLLPFTVVVIIINGIKMLITELNYGKRRPLHQYVIYYILLPFYDMFKLFVMLGSHIHEIYDDQAWRVTVR